jgi:hypothetical protein
MGNVQAAAGDNYTVVVSDEDNFDAVLPLRTVKYIFVSVQSPLPNPDSLYHIEVRSGPSL